MAWHHHISHGQKAWTSKHPWMTFLLAATGIGALVSIATKSTSTTTTAPAAPSAAPPGSPPPTGG